MICSCFHGMMMLARRLLRRDAGLGKFCVVAVEDMDVFESVLNLCFILVYCGAQWHLNLFPWRNGWAPTSVRNIRTRPPHDGSYWTRVVSTTPNGIACNKWWHGAFRIKHGISNEGYLDKSPISRSHPSWICYGCLGLSARPIQCRPFRITLHTLYTSALLGGYIDATTYSCTLSDLIEGIFYL